MENSSSFYQLDFFRDLDRVDALDHKVDMSVKAQDKLRKSMFARHNKLEKRCEELMLHIEDLQFQLTAILRYQ